MDKLTRDDIHKFLTIIVENNEGFSDAMLDRMSDWILTEAENHCMAAGVVDCVKSDGLPLDVHYFNFSGGQAPLYFVTEVTELSCDDNACKWRYSLGA